MSNYRPHSSSLAIKQIATRYATLIGYLHFKNTSKKEKGFHNSNKNFLSILEMYKSQQTCFKFMDGWGKDQSNFKHQRLVGKNHQTRQVFQIFCGKYQTLSINSRKIFLRTSIHLWTLNKNQIQLKLKASCFLESKQTRELAKP